MEEVTLSTMAGGAAEELFQRAFQSILENIHDINTPAESKREILLKFAFVPNEERDMAGLGIEVTFKAAGTKGTSTTLYMPDRKVQGKFPVQEHNPRQMRIMDVTDTPEQSAKEKA